MASVQCRNCKNGIHYHGEPNGIEHVEIGINTWGKIIGSSFDPHNRVMNEATDSPKLFRTDTISEDFPEAITKFWKCPECGALIFFGKGGIVTEVYVPGEPDYTTPEMIDEGVFFEDYQWEEITERAISDTKIVETFGMPDRIIHTESGVALRDCASDKTYYYKVL